MQKTPVTLSDVESALDPLIERVSETPGLMAVLTLELSRRMKRKQYRQNVSEWLHSDSKRRTEPRLSAGLLLLAMEWELSQGIWAPGLPGRSEGRLQKGPGSIVVPWG